MKWFKLRPKNWKWWCWFNPYRWQEIRYYGIVEEIVTSEIKLNEEKMREHFSNMAIFGSCSGDCGYELLHGTKLKEEKQND